jgi:hypothetical protein
MAWRMDTDPARWRHVNELPYSSTLHNDQLPSCMDRETHTFDLRSLRVEL